ncbi:hypothetical protein [Paludibaculum fermentans]|uniref:hypothetical protein n=1 Tax=Paludibaculum fermentans TaxID=1473598 RepID=UPI003EBB7DCB
MNWRPQPPSSSTTSSSNVPAGARRSYALESLTNLLRTQEGLQILDLGGLNQANLDFVTGLGHRLYAEDIVKACDAFFSKQEFATKHFDSHRIAQFIDETFDFPDQSSDGALVWDVLQFLPNPIAQAVLDRLYRILAPDSFLLAFFHPESGGPAAKPHSCRIIDARHLMFMPRESARTIELYTTRSIERFFHQFASVKFFLTRENLQEVIVKR